jgi:PiT family inorganic phosphate transporter
MQAVEMSLTVVVVLVLLALAFDFMNGFHDAANSIATVVSTGVLKPQQAVAWAAFFNVVAIFVFQLKVAATIGKGTIEPGIVDHYVVFGALIGAIAWNIITWYYGIPSSSSHALIGGLVGAAMAKAGTGSLIWAGIGKVVAFIFVSPLLGFILGVADDGGGGLDLPAHRRRARWTSWFRRLQLVSAGAYSLGHGGNDAQKTIGIIWMLLIAAGIPRRASRPPMWVISCYLAIGLGTMFGGWRIVKTMGQRITKLKPVGGFCAETGGAITLFLATGLGIPVSTTHTITGAIVGVGSVRKRAEAVRWGVAGGIVWAWILTITVSRMVVFLYTAPCFTVLGLHFFVPGERMGRRQWAGVMLAFGGLVLAFADKASGGHPLGDFFGILAALFWAATTVLIRATALARVTATKVLLYQLVVSAAIMFPLSWLVGERGIAVLSAPTLLAMAYQIAIVAFASYLAWFWLLTRYLAGRLLVFSFLTPLFGVWFGMLLMGDRPSPGFFLAAALVVCGIVLVNVPARK